MDASLDEEIAEAENRLSELPEYEFRLEEECSKGVAVYTVTNMDACLDEEITEAENRLSELTENELRLEEECSKGDAVYSVTNIEADTDEEIAEATKRLSELTEEELRLVKECCKEQEEIEQTLHIYSTWKEKFQRKIDELRHQRSLIKQANEENANKKHTGKQTSLAGGLIGLGATLAAPFSGGLSLMLTASSIGAALGGIANEYSSDSKLESISKQCKSKVEELLEQIENLIQEIKPAMVKMEEFLNFSKTLNYANIFRYRPDGIGHLKEQYLYRLSDKVFIPVMDVVNQLSRPTVRPKESTFVIKYTIKATQTAMKMVTQSADRVVKIERSLQPVRMFSEAAKRTADMSSITKMAIPIARAKQATDILTKTGERILVATTTVQAGGRHTLQAASNVVSFKPAAEILKKAGEGISCATKTIQAGGRYTIQTASNVVSLRPAVDAGIKLSADIAEKGKTGMNFVQQTFQSFRKSKAIVTTSKDVARVSKLSAAMSAVFIPVDIYRLATHEETEHQLTLHIEKIITEVENTLKDYDEIYLSVKQNDQPSITEI